MKNHLTTAPILILLNFYFPFVVQTDANDFSLGCVHRYKMDMRKSYAIYTDLVSKSERKYSSVENECLAVLFEVEKCRPYLQGLHFTVITDHFSLKWL